MAALYAPVTDELFLATRGGGATRNGEPMQIPARANLNGARIAGPKSHLDRLVGLYPYLRPQPKVFSLALRATLAGVAPG